MRRASVLLILLLGCTAADEQRMVTVQLPATLCGDVGHLSPMDVCSIRLAVLDGRWDTARPESVFDSGCQTYQSDGLAITGFPVGLDYTLYLEAYNGPQCQEGADSLRAVGLRGGIAVLEGAQTNDVWFLPTFGVRQFTAFPAIDPQRKADIAKFPCAVDADCRVEVGSQAIKAGPLARCNPITLMCELPATLFPLDARAKRAFHTATVLADGRIALIGGLGVEADTNADGARFVATDQTVEVFDPVTMTWSIPPVQGLNGLRLAFHTSVGLSGTRVGMIGGLTEARLRVSKIDESLRWLTIDVRGKADSGADNLSRQVLAADLGTGALGYGDLGEGRIGAQAIRGADGKVLVTGGRIPLQTGAGVVETNVVHSCDMSGAAIQCDLLGGLSAARGHHCAACIEGEPSACSRVLLFGGLIGEASATDAIGEVWFGGAGEAFGWRSDSPQATNVEFPTCVATRDGSLYLLGGTESAVEPPAIPPYVLYVTLAEKKIGALDIGNAAALKAATRVHSAAVELADGRVLVTGGVDSEGHATSSAYILSGADVVETHSMRQARFGHTATRLERGALAGAVLIVGGFMIGSDDRIRFVEGAELFIP